MKQLFLILLLLEIFVTTALSQVLVIPHLQRDDFERNRSWWLYRADYPIYGGTPQVPPDPRNGYLYFILQSPQPGIGDPMHNVAIESGSQDELDQIYTQDDTLFLKIRARFVTDHQPGSRGWGYWYTESGVLEKVEQVWFMQSEEDTSWGLNGDGTWWQAQKVNGRTYSTSQTVDLSKDLLTGWHTYEIRRYGRDRIEFYADGNLVMLSNIALPEEPYDFHHWIDNQVYHPEDDPDAEDPDSFKVAVYRAWWTGTNEMVTDYVQIIYGSEPISYTESPTGIVKLRDYPNEIGTGETEYLWKSYNFETFGGQTLVLVTAKAEEYDGYDNPDRLKIVLDGTDYGYGGTYGWDGDVLQAATKNVLISNTLASGTHTLQLYGQVTPILYDVTVLSSGDGIILVNDEPNETAPSGSNNYLWKTYQFSYFEPGEVAIYIVASADENPGWSFQGPDHSSPNVDDSQDDDLRIELDGTDYGWKTKNSWYGNELFGEVRTVLIHDTLLAGTHYLRLYANNTPTLYRVLVFGGNFDASLPVQLNSFTVEVNSEGHLLKWRTESEVENLGFNIYRAVTEDTILPSMEAFKKINNKLIPGAGNSNVAHNYQWLDENVIPNKVHWYILEDVDYQGNREKHSPIFVVNKAITVETFQLRQNYPNPFNPTTTIPFDLPQADWVKVEIFGLQGQKVRTLLNDYLPAGSHQVVWDGCDDRRIPVVSGVYYYRLVTSDQTLVRKMILLR